MKLMYNRKIIDLKGEITSIVFNLFDDTARISIDIEGKQYELNFSFKSGNYVFASQLKSNMLIKFKGIIGKKNKEICNPHDIWVKID